MYYDVSIVGYGIVCQYGMVCQNGMMLVCYGMLSYDMLYQLVGFPELFTGYEMEVETHVHLQILNQLLM